MEKSILHKRIMRRIYFVYTLQWLFSPRMVKLGLFSLSIVGLASLVSVGNVIANAPYSNVGAFFTFVVYAFANTTAVVQALSLIAGVCAVWYMRDVMKTVVPRVAFS